MILQVTCFLNYWGFTTLPVAAELIFVGKKRERGHFVLFQPPLNYGKRDDKKKSLLFLRVLLGPFSPVCLWPCFLSDESEVLGCGVWYCTREWGNGSREDIFFFKFYWGVVDLQGCINFRHPARWFSYRCIVIFFFILISIAGYYGILNRVLCAIQQILVDYLFLYILVCIC